MGLHRQLVSHLLSCSDIRRARSAMGAELCVHMDAWLLAPKHIPSDACSGILLITSALGFH